MSAINPQKNIKRPISETLALAAKQNISKPTMATNSGTNAINIPGA